MKNTHYLDLFNKHTDRTCFILKDEKIVFSSSKNGVSPILDYYKESGISKEPLTIVDKIVGKGAALLSIYVGAVKLITPIISESAIQLLNKYNIEVYYEEVVPFIVNRDKDGRCPIESSILDIDDIEEGYKIIVDTLKELANKK